MKTSVKSYGEILGRYLRPHRRQAALLGLLLLVNIGLQLLNPQIIRRFIDAAQSQADLSQLLYAALAFFGIGLLVQGGNLLATWLSTDLGFRTTNALRRDLAEHCLHLDMAFHNDRTPGELIERIDGDVTALATFFSRFVLDLFGNGLLMAGILALLFVEDWRVGLAVTAFTAVSMGVLLSLRALGVAESAAERQGSADLFGFLEERVAGLDDIRANGLGDYTMLRFYHRMRAFFQAARTAFRTRAIVWRVMFVLYGLGQVLTLGIAAWLFFRGVVTIGTAYLLYSYVEMLADPMERLANQIQDLQKATASIQRTRELLSLQPSIVDGPLDGLPEGPLPLDFAHVAFRYTDGEPVLHDLSFHLEPGAVLGLLGRTGSGKTTLTRLLFRLYEPHEGVIRLAGRPLREMQLAALRQRVGMVTQEVQLFRATVRDNLTFFDPNVPDEEIVAVLRDLGMGDWYDNLPNGLDTELGGGESGLSAGEAQLLAFARAFLRDPGLVILDEPSSRLDPATERLLEHAMQKLLQGRTGIIIAHRLGTVQRVDQIMIMDGGRVCEHGRREDLAHDPDSRFYHLLTTGMEEAIA